MLPAMRIIDGPIFKKFLFFFLSFTVFLLSQEIEEKSCAASSISENHDVCNLSAIYNSIYSYHLPEEILQDFLGGRGFDYPKEYTLEEFGKLNADINDLFQAIMDSNPVKANLAIISAGSPGAGKTMLMKQKAEASAKEGFAFSYVCPDDFLLRGLKRTYASDIEAEDSLSQKVAYTKWRPASNAAAHIVLANLIKDKYAFYFGTTCSSPMTYKFFEFLKKQGYKIKVIHLSASDKVRWDSIQERDKSFIQTTKEDIYEKGLMMPQRINDVFLKYADEIEFYYRRTVASDAVHAATWIKTEGAPFSGELAIFNERAYKGVKEVHNAAVAILQRPELQWEDTVEPVSAVR